MKKTILLGLLILLLVPFASAGYLLGDFDGDGEVGVMDKSIATLLLYNKPVVCDDPWGNVFDCLSRDPYQDGKITQGDVDIISDILNGKTKAIEINESGIYITADYIAGDFDGDNTVGVNDKSILNLYINGKNPICRNSAGEIINCIERDIYNDGKLTAGDMGIMNDILNGKAKTMNMTYEYFIVWEYLNETECQPDNTKIIIYNDTNGLFGTNETIETCDYIPIWTLINETECYSNGTKIMAYNDTSGLFGLNETIESCVYVPIWTFINETECYSDGTKITTYNETSGLFGLNYIIENCAYTAPAQPSGGGSSGGGGGSSDNHPALVTPTMQETRTLEQPIVEEQPTQEPETTAGPTGAATAGNTDITNYALGGIISLVIMIAGFFLWKKYK